MFDDQDPEKVADFDKRVPDGLIDGTQYAEILSNIIENMNKLKQDSYLSNITWIMDCVNESYQKNEPYEFDKTKSLDVITSLSYIVMTLVSAIDDPDFIDNFIEIQKNEVLPDLNSNASMIPFYDIENEVNNILSILDDFENGEYGDD